MYIIISYEYIMKRKLVSQRYRYRAKDFDGIYVTRTITPTRYLNKVPNYNLKVLKLMPLTTFRFAVESCNEKRINVSDICT